MNKPTTKYTDFVNKDGSMGTTLIETGTPESLPYTLQFSLVLSHGTTGQIAVFNLDMSWEDSGNPEIIRSYSFPTPNVRTLDLKCNYDDALSTLLIKFLHATSSIESVIFEKNTPVTIRQKIVKQLDYATI